jgi:glyoxylase-like metal-dependent hydrolase (beta-lactamase superfamily II)
MIRVNLLKSNPKVYSCYSYLIRGEWNTLSDVNTLIDVGTDGSIIEEINQISTGVGKKKIEQIILTHEHFDHVGGLSKVKEFYNNPVVYGFNKIQGVDKKLSDGMKIKIGDEEAEIIHTPGHSQDSVCIYFNKSNVLFSGDTVLFIKSKGGSYSIEYIQMIERFMKYNLKTIYSGHDLPVTENINKHLAFSLSNIKESELITI